jgi:hypothetical protein
VSENVMEGYIHNVLMSSDTWNCVVKVAVATHASLAQWKNKATNKAGRKAC